MPVLTPPEQGQLVTVRQRRYVVSDVLPGSLPQDPLKPQESPQHLLTLQCVEDDAMGEELQVIWEIEPGARAHDRLALPEASGCDDPMVLDAFLNAVRWGAVSSADTSAIQAPFRSGIDLEVYQLDPLVRAIQMPRVSLLIADDVGLGKTIEAGMVIQELILRHRARRVLVVCPSSLQLQWRDQMRDKFGLDFRIVDTALLRELRRTRGLHVNPWTHFPRLITSIDFLKRDRPMRLLRDVLPHEGEPKYPRQFDILVVDEAHNVAPPRSGAYATDSLRTQAIRALAPHCEHKLFLTATPHNGFPESFTALLELLDNQRFARGVKPAEEQKAAVMVRRLKTELVGFDGKARFPRRDLEHLEVPYGAEERQAHAWLQEYTRLRAAGVGDDAERFATEFVLKTLKKRLFSSPAAFARTLEQHEVSLKTARKRESPLARPSLGVVKEVVDRVEEEFADDDVLDETTEDALDASTRLFREPSPAERDLLRKMREWAQRSERQGDAKSERLLAWLEENVKPDGRWSDRRVIIFTEYRATQKWLQDRLATRGLAEPGRLQVMYGGMVLDRREEIKAAFQADPSESPVRILLATDAASEGIDLQNHCARLIHYEIPWNPNRLEQRNGRIDRHGQRGILDDEGRPYVLIHHFVGAGFDRRISQPERPGDLEGDIEFLYRAAAKVQKIREDLGTVGPVIARQVEEAMLGRRERMDTRRAEEDAKPIRQMLKFERDLQKQIQVLHDRVRESRILLNVTPENIREAVEVGLRLAGWSPLIAVDLPEAGVTAAQALAFRVPRMEGSWQQSVEGLLHPHTREIRPITFDEAVARRTDKVVYAHLNHRFVQQCTRLLRAQVWSVHGTEKIHRISCRTVPDRNLAEPAVVAHARLVITGGDSQRLHEELICAGGFLRDGRFARFQSLQEMSRALEHVQPSQPSQDMVRRLLEHRRHHDEPLRRALEVRMNEMLDGVRKRLTERGEKEARDIEAVLRELEKSIRQELHEPQYLQLELPSDDLERDQLQRDINALKARLTEIPGEIAREQARLRARYADPRPHLFPVAVTYLVPERLSRG